MKNNSWKSNMLTLTMLDAIFSESVYFFMKKRIACLNAVFAYLYKYDCKVDLPTNLGVKILLII